MNLEIRLPARLQVARLLPHRGRTEVSPSWTPAMGGLALTTEAVGVCGYATRTHTTVIGQRIFVLSRSADPLRSCLTHRAKACLKFNADDAMMASTTTSRRGATVDRVLAPVLHQSNPAASAPRPALDNARGFARARAQTCNARKGCIRLATAFAFQAALHGRSPWRRFDRAGTGRSGPRRPIAFALGIRLTTNGQMAARPAHGMCWRYCSSGEQAMGIALRRFD